MYFDALPDNAVRVKNALNWVTPEGHLYGIETRTQNTKNYHKYFRYKTTVNKHNGYVYAPIKYIDKDGSAQIKQRRLHIVIAESLIENPNNYPIVGHRNNIKTDNRSANLYWTTISENTQKAVDDGLFRNDKSYSDSQSMPVVMFNTYTNQELGRYGSASEAERITGIAMGTILRQCRYKTPVRKPFYFRFQNDPAAKAPLIVARFEYDSDVELERFLNAEEASRKTGVSRSTIQAQCKNGFKPRHRTKDGTYFKII